MKKIGHNKKGVSLMISYVLLVVIAIVMSVVVFSYLRYVANVEPVIDCNDGTSIIVEDYACDPDVDDRIQLTMRNNGRFNVKGFAATFGGNSLQEPTNKLITTDTDRLNPIDGSYLFENPLKPGELIDVNFGIKEVKANGSIGDAAFSFLKKIKVQPYIYDEEADLDVPCSNAIIRQDIQNCQIKEFSLLLRPVAEYDFAGELPAEDDPNFQTALETLLEERGITTPVPKPGIHYEFEDNLRTSVGTAHIQQSLPNAGLEKFTEGYVGRAIDYDGNYNLRTNRNLFRKATSDDFLTVGFWIKKDSHGSDPLAKRRGSGAGFELDLTDSRINAQTALPANLAVCDTQLPNQWSHVTATFSRTTTEIGKIKIYINGELCIEENSGTESLRSSTHFFLGKNGFVGQIDEFKVWKQELTVEEVASLYSSYINN